MAEHYREVPTLKGTVRLVVVIHESRRKREGLSAFTRPEI